MKTLKFILTLFFVASTFFSFAEDTLKPVSVSGKVIDKESGEALAGVAVELKGTNVKVYTDLTGQFTLDNVMPGEYNVELSFISYEDLKISDFKVSSSQAVDVELEMSPEL